MQLEDAPMPNPRFIGGFAFNPNAQMSAPWSHFANTEFVLPQWTYERSGDQAFLSIIFSDAKRPDELIAEAFKQLECSFSSVRDNFETIKRLDLQEDSVAAWKERLESIYASISKGEASKIVAARKSLVTAEQDFKLGSILCQLHSRDPESIKFAYPSTNSVFAGASPERLIKKEGLTIQTEALAGTIDANQGKASQQLKESNKDRAEHAFVCEFIVNALSPLCSKLKFASTPGLRPLRDVLHLSTKITGQLQSSTHILDLVEHLHPTPAVAGLPSSFALQEIEANEKFCRGWYAGPIGWFDKSGDGEFAVALRCGVIEGAEAHLFSGAGIVAASEPDAEYEETKLKQNAFLSALGLR